MKIVALGLRGIPDVMGGVETHCEQLYPRMRRLAPDIDITVLARKPYVSDDRDAFDGVTIRPIPAITHPYFEAILHTFLGLIHARFTERADVVHIHAVGPGLLIPVAKLLGLSVVFTHHGEDYRRDKWNGVAKAALRFGERMAARFSNRMISVSRPVAKSIVERYPDLVSRIRVIPNGAALEAEAGTNAAEAASVLAELGLTPGRYVMTVARLVPEKGIHDLVEAASGLPEGMKLVVVGGAQHGGAYAEGLLAKASDRIVFAGAMPRGRIAPLYRNTALFVLPSYHEGLPIVALEALAMGARVLLSDIDANRDLKLDAANYFPVGDIEALRRKLADPASIPMADTEFVLARYDWDVIARETLDLFRSLGKVDGSFRPARLVSADDRSG